MIIAYDIKSGIAQDTFYEIYDFNHLVDLLMITDIELLIMKTNQMQSQFAVISDNKSLFIILSSRQYVIQSFPTGISHD